jgi:hypothetical protein
MTSPFSNLPSPKVFFPFEPTIHTTITRTNQPLKDVSLQKQTINEKYQA